VSVRDLVRFDPPATITFYTQLCAAVATGLMLPFIWVTPDWKDLLGLILIGMIGGVTQFWNALALRYAPAAVVAPFTYLQMIWAIGLDFVFWTTLPSVSLLIGVALVMASTLFMLYYHSRRQRSRQP
jgi:drug/metabolite transporter (DMT)-like permease